MEYVAYDLNEGNLNKSIFYETLTSLLVYSRYIIQITW